MKTFKDKAYLPPVDKIRKDLGRFQEKVDRKGHMPTIKSGPKLLLSNPTHSKKGLGFGAYFVLFLLVCITALFLFMVYTLIFVKSQTNDEL